MLAGRMGVKRRRVKQNGMTGQPLKRRLRTEMSEAAAAHIRGRVELSYVPEAVPQRTDPDTSFMNENGESVVPPVWFLLLTTSSS